ncbi:Zn(2)-C6 fungal-specific transcription factor [Mucor lusitanicus]|uniref:Zn(2)-C6 fungal-specific transcription factor n=2 Tax=Mucor circinelloides f. lusitanicus TaxID=29924 RepID=A0A168LTI7_MUCCL|nr:Zn(2)-C6 fungal-specific transcription factor [Mucor lusitanicus]OAD03940.1 Zn(2)-C6 fungal-specific transcription factor [Mucor lusitanicus CBS 277.49]
MPQDTIQQQQQQQQHQSTQQHLAANASNATAEPRKKRAKIMSACGECRRKKTKCNGEQPCRNCQKSNAACIYPTASQMDDKRNHGGPSKAALEAIEDRLKAIEDMLKTILQSQLPVHDLDPVAVSNFLTKSNDNSSNSNNRLPSIHNLSAVLPTDATANASYHHSHHHHPHHPASSSSPASSHPHHHGMVSPSTPNVNHLPPPIGLMQNEMYQQQHPLQQQQQHHHQGQQRHPPTIYQSQEEQRSLQPMKKRKR